MVLLFAFLLGQIASAQQQPFDVTPGMLSDGHPAVTIKNNSVYPITGIIMTVDPSGGASVTGNEVRSYFDVYINRNHDLRILSGGSHTFPVAHIVGIDKSTLNPQIRAVVFEDGSTWGDVSWVSKITSMRKRLFEELGTAGDLLEKGVRGNASADQIRSEVERERDVRINEDRFSDVEIPRIDAAILAHVSRELRRASQANSGSQSKTEAPIVHLKRHLEMWRRYVGSARSMPAPGTGQITSSFNATSHRASSGSNLGAKLRLASLRTSPGTLSHSAPYVVSCDATDVSVQIGPRTTCGSVNFDLKAMTTDGEVIDFGLAASNAQCIASYTDCQGTFHDASTSPPATRIFVHDSIANGTEAEFHWILDNYTQASFTACSCDDPNPNGQNLVNPVNIPVIASPATVVCH